MICKAELNKAGFLMVSILMSKQAKKVQHSGRLNQWSGQRSDSHIAGPLKDD